MPTIRPSPQRTRLDGGIAASGASASDFGGGAALGQAGAALEDFGSSINRAQQQQEISDLNVFTTETNGRYMAQLAEAARLSPLGDNSYAEKLQEGMSADLAKRSESISTAGGQRAFNQLSATMRVDFAARVSGSVVKRAGDKAVLDHTRIVDANNNLVRQDPSQLPDILARIRTMAKDPSSIYAAAPDGAEKLLQDDTYKLYGSYVSGLIDRDAGDTLDKLNKGLYDNVLTDDDKVRKIAEAEATIRAEKADANARRAAEDRARNEASEKRMDEILKNPQPGDAKRALGDPNLTPQHKIAISKFLTTLYDKENTGAQQDEMRRVGLNIKDIPVEDIRNNPVFTQAQVEHMEAYKARVDGADKKDTSLDAVRRYNERIAQDSQSVTQAEVLNDRSLTEPDKNLVLGRIKAFSDKPPTTTQASAGVSNELYRRMNLPPGDPQRVNDISEIMNAFSSGWLLRADHDWLIKQYTDAKTVTGVKLDKARTDFWKGHSGFISRSIVGKQMDTVGESKLWEAQQWAAAREAQYRKEGKDPRNLYMPAHPDGKEFLQNIRSFKPSLDETLRGMSGTFGVERDFPPPSLNQSLWNRFAKPAEAQPDAPKPPAALPRGAVFGGYAEDGRAIWFSADRKRKWFSK